MRVLLCAVSSSLTGTGNVTTTIVRQVDCRLESAAVSSMIFFKHNVTDIKDWYALIDFIARNIKLRSH